MARTLQVGVIGASAERGWAKISHVPAIQGLDGLELAAVVTKDDASARAAAQAFGARAGYGDPKALFADPAIDIVTVAVNVPAHRDLVLGALAASKHVLCEHPLGRNLAESEELAAAARKAGVHAAVGLQARTHPAARKARDLIASGTIGRVLNARVLSTTAAFGPIVEAALAFAEDEANGVTLATIQGSHTLDLAIAVLGELAEAQALMSTQFPEVEVETDGGRETRPRTIPDHMLVQARLADGAPLALEVVGGAPPDVTPFRMEVTGDRGRLALEGGAARGFQSGVLRLRLNGEPMATDAPDVSEPETAVNVSGLYARLRDDINTGTWTAPDFDHGVRVVRLMEALTASSRTGQRRPAQGWPTP